MDSDSAISEDLPAEENNEQKKNENQDAAPPTGVTKPFGIAGERLEKEEIFKQIKASDKVTQAM